MCGYEPIREHLLPLVDSRDEPRKPPPDIATNRHERRRQAALARRKVKH